MKDLTYKPKGEELDDMDAYFAAIAFSELGEVETAEEFIESLGPHCKKGYDYDEEHHLCVAKG
ncbi:MAG: hypothetical protein HZA22_05375 [Nitrospirae bacterium]|nr:hypothetical protein [Nitrospirota bacterium]